jgi:plasmid stabilization system protein ParE
MRRLILSDGALRDLTEIGRYLTRKSGDAQTGRRVTRALRDQCVRFASLPGTLGRARPDLRPELRSFPFKGYIIFFRYRGDVMEVVKIAGGRQDLPRLFENSDDD